MQTVVAHKTKGNMRELLKILVILILVSCQTKTKENNGNSEDSIKSVDSEIVQVTNELSQTVDDNNITEETFMDFFGNFMWNREFQNERIVYPINYKGKQLESKKDWKYNRFYTVKSYMPILHTDTITYYDKDVSDNLLTMSIVSFENQESENFDFKRTVEGWKLVKVGIQHIDSLIDIGFINFIKQFSSDSIFQKEHVAFPIPNYYVDYDNDYEIVYDSLISENWKYMQFENELGSLMTFNEDISSVYRIIFFRGIENGIHAKYTFKKFGQEWRLIKLEDYST
jgi:hypothetical protein